MFVALGTHIPWCTSSLSSPSSQCSSTHIPRIWKLVSSKREPSTDPLYRIYFNLEYFYIENCCLIFEILQRWTGWSPRHWELEDLGFEHYEAPKRERTSYLVVCCVTYGRILQVVLHIITIYRMRVICQVSWLAINSIRQSVQMLAFSFFFQVSNYARRHADSAMRSKHNQIYWHGKPYAAYGNGAASFVNAVRASRNLVTLD